MRLKVKKKQVSMLDEEITAQNELNQQLTATRDAYLEIQDLLEQDNGQEKVKNLVRECKKDK